MAKESDLHYDTPLQRPEDDRLERAGFARSLADAILKMDAETGFCFALHGPWGSGKSTTLNFVLSHLEAEAKDQIVVVRFNPWWFSGSEQLLHQFLAQFGATIREKGAGAKLLRGIAKQLGTFADIIEPVPVPGAGVLARVLQHVRGAVVARDVDIDKIRGGIDTSLRKSGRHFLVVIDDVDRLRPEEVRQLFQIIKAVADFPRTIYLLAFDRAFVAKALEAEQGGSGEDFLAKIVQVSFDLPSGNRPALRNLLFQQLEGIFEGTPDDLWDKQVWGNIFWGGIEPLIRTPRDIVRFVNALRTSYPLVRGEVFATDFFALQAVRVFAPAFYAAIAVQGRPLTGSAQTPSGKWRDKGVDAKTLGRFLELVTEDIREPVSSLMGRVFPRWSHAFALPGDAGEPGDGWRKMRRARDSATFDLFFQFVVPTGQLGRLEMLRILDLIAVPSQLAGELLRMTRESVPGGVSKARQLLDEMEDYTGELAEPAIAPFLEGLFKVGDEILMLPDRGGFLDAENRVQVARIIYRLLKRLPSSAVRRDVLANACRATDAVGLVVDAVGMREPEAHDDHDTRQEKRDLIDETDFQQLKEIALGKIREAREAGRLYRAPNLALVLTTWKGWSPEEVPAYAPKAAADDEGLVALITAFTTESTSLEMGDRVGRVAKRFHIKTFRNVLGLEPSEFRERVTAFVAAPPDCLAPDSRASLGAFLQALEEPGE